MTTADKLEAEATRWKNHANMLRQQPITPHGLEIAEVLSWVVDRDEALAAAWRALTTADEAIGDHVVRLTDGTWVCSICKALNMINALEIDA